MYLAALDGNEAEVTRLLEYESVDPNYTEKESGMTPLIAATMKTHTRVIRRLLTHRDIDINYATPSVGLTALHVAAQNGNLDVVS